MPCPFFDLGPMADLQIEIAKPINSFLGFR